jgi:hypothetical protein
MEFDKIYSVVAFDKQKRDLLECRLLLTETIEILTETLREILKEAMKIQHNYTAKLS